MRTRLSSLVLGSSVVIYLAACGSDTAGPPSQNGVCTGESITVPESQGRVIKESELPCLSIPADGGTYLVVPQFATATAPVNVVNFTLSAATAGAAATSIVAASRRTIPALLGATADQGQAQRRLEGILRKREGEVAAAAQSSGSAMGARAGIVHANAPPPVLGSSQSFHVLSNFTSGNTYTTDTATLKYIGAHLLIYQSKNAVAPAGFTDSQIAGFGNTFDLDLYPIDFATFGSPSDIDANGRVIVLLSPIINKLTDAGTCTSSGFIAGFFNAVDLLPNDFVGKSNGAEIFYSLVPDPAATFSCTHTSDAVEQLTPSTFIHEFQHMISFGQHSIIRHGNDEASWLNEGLSHVAEELGSRYYENRFPPPTGRTDPGQAFPDSAQGFITGELFNSYHYLLDPASTDASDKASVSNWGTGDGTLVQRGAAWLFLRWLGDQQDSLVYGRLDQTTLTSVPNVEGASGASFSTLFGEFALALYTDSLPGVPRSSIPSALRFKSRNLRALYAKQNQRNGGSFPLAFPIPVHTLQAGGALSGAMFPGTMDYFRLTAPSSGVPIGLSFQPTGSSSSFSSTLGAQVSVFHCPSAAACPLSVP